jgi:transposase
MSPVSCAVFKDPFVIKIRLELRKLRQDASRYEHAWGKQKEINKKLKDELSKHNRDNERLEKELSEAKKKNKELKEQLDLVTGQNQKLAENAATFQFMLFGRKDRPQDKSSRKQGGQPGHIGLTRKSPLPENITETKEIFLSVCPDCGAPLNHGKHLKSHIVEDIPELLELKTIITKYEIEEQYCTHCQKHVRAIPEGVIPGSRLGLNLVLLLIVLRTVSNQSLYQICKDINIIFGTDISPGGVEAVLHRGRDHLGHTYDEILQAVRQAKVKHADETSWKVDGATYWNWVFATTQEVYHIIQDTRGKGVPQKVIGGSNCRKDSVLVRDDYAGYNDLDCDHQRCWSHLLRVCRDQLKLHPNSIELKALHATLGTLFGICNKTITEPLKMGKQKRVYRYGWSILKNIINTEYKCPGAKKVQTRLKNEGKDILTALLYEGVPLTNNLAERIIRPMVIFRKITGGSRSAEGAKTTAVLRSVTQTIEMRKQPLIETLKEELLRGILAQKTLTA